MTTNHHDFPRLCTHVAPTARKSSKDNSYHGSPRHFCYECRVNHFEFSSYHVIVALSDINLEAIYTMDLAFLRQALHLLRRWHATRHQARHGTFLFDAST